MMKRVLMIGKTKTGDWIHYSVLVAEEYIKLIFQNHNRRIIEVIDL